MDLATEPGLTSALRGRGYQVRGPAGVGGSGTAWGATAADGRRVVVGVVDLDVTLVERRAAVARIDELREITHPHLARLTDVVALDGHRTALVVDAVEGPTLGAVLAVRPRWEPGEVVTLLVPLAGALARLHGKGLAHGDVAPENVVLAPGGRPVLVDLAGVVLPGGGTPGFAPSRDNGTPRADLHALARLGRSLLGDGADGDHPGDRALRGALDAALAGHVDADAFATACFDAAPAKPLELPDPGILTRIALTRLAENRPAERTLPDPRARRRRRITQASAGLAAAVVLVATLALVLPLRPGDDDPAQAASRLTEQRAEVLTARDAARLAEVALEGSPAFEADEALIVSLVERDEQPDVRVRVLESRWIEHDDGRELVAVTFAQEVAGEKSEPRSVVLALVETEDGWRVVDVLAHVEPDEVSDSVGPLAG